MKIVPQLLAFLGQYRRLPGRMNGFRHAMRSSVIGRRNHNISGPRSVAGASRKPWKRTGVCTCNIYGWPSMPSAWPSCGVSSDSYYWTWHGVAWVKLFFFFSLFVHGFPCHSMIPGVFGITNHSVAMVVIICISLRADGKSSQVVEALEYGYGWWMTMYRTARTWTSYPLPRSIIPVQSPSHCLEARNPPAFHMDREFGQRPVWRPLTSAITLQPHLLVLLAC